MAKNKLFACLLAGALALSLTACGKPSSSSTDATTGTSENPTTGETPATTTEEVSVDFEDGKFGFVAPYLGAAGASEVELSIADFGGSKALKVDNVGGKTPYIGIDVTSLLGDKVADVATIEANFGVSYADGKFSPVVGVFTTWTGEDLTQTNYKWTVYLENKNPYKGKFDISAVPFVAGNKNIVTLGLNTTANGVDAAAVKTATIYVDNIRFLDKDGKLIVADTSAEFDEPDGFSVSGEDRSNLYNVSNAVEFPDFETSGDAWGQNGFEIPQEIIDALVPGSVVEVEFSSEDGTLWMVLPDAQKGWMRVAQGEAFINNSKNVAQITYEQIVALVGEDKAAWGTADGTSRRMQFESQTAWSVSSVKVGTKSEQVMCTNPVEFEGFETSGDAWGQNGFEMTQEIVDALVPGSVIEIDYTSEDGTMWIVMPDSQKGWMRVAQGTAVCTGSKCYITYEQLVEAVGEDKAAWGTADGTSRRLQCESQTAWSVTGVRVGTLAKLPVANVAVPFEGFETSGDAWGQNGFEMTQEIVDALVPGSVIAIDYTSEDGTMWIVMPDSQKGWMRVAQGTAVCTGSTCYITYEQLVEAVGDDKAAWGTADGTSRRMQCESQTAWSVTGVRVISVK